MIDVLLADNQLMTREGLKVLLSGILDIRIAGIAGNPRELEQLIIKFPHGIVIIDPRYDTQLSLEDIKAIKARFELTRILVLTNRQSRNEILEITGLGIKNFVFKECSREELVHAIYTVARGGQFFCKHTFEILFGNKLLPEKKEGLPQLSAREMELVHLIAEGLTNKEIAEKLFLSIHTIKTHRKNIIKKLGFTFKNTAELAVLLQRG